MSEIGATKKTGPVFMVFRVKCKSVQDIAGHMYFINDAVIKR